jgi:hypothetical protein
VDSNTPESVFGGLADPGPATLGADTMGGFFCDVAECGLPQVGRVDRWKIATFAIALTGGEVLHLRLIEFA